MNPLPGLALLAAAEVNARGAGRLIVPLFAAAAVVLAARGAYLLFAALIRFNDREDHASAPETFVIGWPLFGLLCYLTGLVSTSAAMMGALTLLLAALAVVGDRQQRRRSAPARIDTSRDSSLREWVAVTLFGVAAVITFLFAQLPAVTLDEVAYHLAVPRIWVATGRVVELPLLSHSYFPFGIESTALPLLAFLGSRGAIAVHFVHFAMAVAGVVMLAQRVGRGLWLAVAAIAATPALLVTAGWAWVDFELTVLAAALFFALRDHVTGKAGLVRAALVLAAGLLTKYTFGPIAVVLFAVAFFTHRSETAASDTDSHTRKALTWSVLTGGILGSAFFVRNLVLTGNPFEPLFSRSGEGLFGYRSVAGSFSQLMTYLFDIRFVDEALGVTIVLLILAAWLKRRQLTAFDSRTLLMSSLLVVVLFLLAPSSRILLPYLVIPAAIGAMALPGARERLVRVLLSLAAIVQLGFVALYAGSQGVVPVLSGVASEDQYLQQYRRAYSDSRWISAQLPPQSRTLVVGSLELFWFDRDVRGGGNFDGARVASYLNAPVKTLRQRLAADGITHIAVIGSGITQASSPEARRRERETVLTPAAATQFRNFLRQQELIARRGKTIVFRLR